MNKQSLISSENNLTAAIITLNEEEKLKNCLESLKDLADEIVVVDSGSSDKTLEIAKEFKAKIYERKFDNFANQKNFAIEKSTSKWILSIDADEVIPKSLAEEIKKAIENSEFNAYLIPRRNFILGAEIKYSRWSPDKHIWLFEKNKSWWVNEVHEEIKVEGKVGELKNAKLHYQDKTISGFIKGNDFYANLLAKNMYKNGQRFSLFRLFYDPIFEFSVRYIYKKGFLDGWRGLVLSILMAYYQLTVWLKILALQNK